MRGQRVLGVLGRVSQPPGETATWSRVCVSAQPSTWISRNLFSHLPTHSLPDTSDHLAIRPPLRLLKHPSTLLPNTQLSIRPPTYTPRQSASHPSIHPHPSSTHPLTYSCTQQSFQVGCGGTQLWSQCPGGWDLKKICCYLQSNRVVQMRLCFKNCKRILWVPFMYRCHLRLWKETEDRIGIPDLMSPGFRL